MAHSTTSDETSLRYQTCIQAHAGIVRKVAASYAWNDVDRADLIQDILAALWQAWPRYDPARPVATWMYRVALNVAVSHVREETLRQRHHVALDPELHQPVDAGYDHEVAQQERLLHVAMAGLDPMSRALLLLHLDDYGHAAIAGVLGISESNVATRLTRIRQRLRKQLAGHHVT